jgi:hypothetical protein
MSEAEALGCPLRYLGGCVSKSSSIYIELGRSGTQCFHSRLFCISERRSYCLKSEEMGDMSFREARASCASRFLVLCRVTLVTYRYLLPVGPTGRTPTTRHAMMDRLSMKSENEGKEWGNEF